MNKLDINCPMCEGAGHVRLAAHLFRVYKEIYQHDEVGAVELRDMLYYRTGEIIKPAALSNRLDKLYKYGVVKRHQAALPKGGQQWVYQIKNVTK